MLQWMGSDTANDDDEKEKPEHHIFYSVFW